MKDRHTPTPHPSIYPLPLFSVLRLYRTATVLQIIPGPDFRYFQHTPLLFLCVLI